MTDAPFPFLVGTWVGQGRGEYPTIEPFAYGEEVVFRDPGKPVLAYAQRTWRLPDGPALHAESGYWRAPAPGRAELVLAHPTGVVEVEEGTVEGARFRLATTAVAATASAKRVDRLERDLEVDGDVLRYELRMAAVGQPLRFHLAAELRRVG